jgi:hypothetical protein
MGSTMAAHSSRIILFSSQFEREMRTLRLYSCASDRHLSLRGAGTARPGLVYSRGRDLWTGEASLPACLRARSRTDNNVGISSR